MSAVDVDSLTLKQVREIAALVGCATKPAAPSACTERPVVVRSAQSGVWFGHMVARRSFSSGETVTLRRARKIWNWKGANTTSDIAAAGVAVGSSVAPPVNAIVAGCCEVLDVSPAAVAAIESRSWQK